MSEFKSYLTKFSSKKDEDRVVVEYVLTHMSVNQPSQEFLKMFDDAYQTNMMSCFNNIEWSSITFKLRIPRLNVSFDGQTLKSDLVGIKVNRKETTNSINFKYDLIFNKQNDPEDAITAITYLKRKEENSDGKSVFVEYKTDISNI